MRKILVAAGRGAIGGFLASIPMGLWLLVAHRTFMRGPHPSVEVAGNSARTVGAEPTRKQSRVAAVIGHFAVGTAGGAAYGVAHRLVGRRLSGPVQGLIFGGLMYLANFVGLFPAARILPPVGRERRGRVAGVLGAHEIYGGVLGAVVDAEERSA
jgi:hypothetical protein